MHIEQVNVVNTAACDGGRVGIELHRSLDQAGAGAAAPAATAAAGLAKMVDVDVQCREDR